MRRLTFCLALLTLLIAGTVGAYRIIEVPEAVARTTVMLVGGGVAAEGGSCATLYHSATTSSTNTAVGYEDNNTYGGIYFTDATGPNICSVKFSVYAVNGDVSGYTYQAEIHALNSSYALTPASPIKVSDGITNIATGVNTFTFSSSAVLSGGDNDHYCIVVTRSDHGNSTTNYIAFDIRETDGDSGYAALIAFDSAGAYRKAEAAQDYIYELYTP